MRVLTTADELEAEVRVAMACLTEARGFDTARIRAEEIEWIDACLDAYNEQQR